MRIGDGVMILSAICIALEGYFSFRDCMFTPAQLRKKYPGRRGLPFICHGGMWGDLVLITPLLGVIVNACAHAWTAGRVLFMGAVGLLLSAVMHMFYLEIPFPDSLAWKEGLLSRAGWFHYFFMAGVFGIVGLLYVPESEASVALLLEALAVLTVHVILANHIPLGCLVEVFRWTWCPDFLASREPWITSIAALVALGVLTSYSYSLRLGLVGLLLGFLIIAVSFVAVKMVYAPR